MEQSLKIGNYEVLSTGSVLIPKDEYAEFSFDTLNFRIIFREEKDDEGKVTNGHYELNIPSSGECLEIIMYNQNRAMFSSSPNFIAVATLGGRKLFLKFCIHSINIKDNYEDKLFFYTWYWEKQLETTELTSE